MIWADFYDRYSGWSESTVKTRISSLEDIGNGDEVVDVCLNLCDERIKDKLIRRSMNLGVRFTHDDFMNLDGEISEELFEEVARYSGFSAENPFFNENDFDWDEFYSLCTTLSEDVVLRCIPRIKRFGDSSEVADAVESLLSPADDLLYERAVESGVKFTKPQLEMMGRDLFAIADEINKFNETTDEQMEAFKKQVGVLEKRADEYIEQLKRCERKKKSAQRKRDIVSFLNSITKLFGGKKKR